MFQSRKPLLWERLKWTKRFEFVDKEKVIHVIGDDHSNEAWLLDEWSVQYKYFCISIKIFILHAGLLKWIRARLE